MQSSSKSVAPVQRRFYRHEMLVLGGVEHKSMPIVDIQVHRLPFLEIGPANSCAGMIYHDTISLGYPLLHRFMGQPLDMKEKGCSSKGRGGPTR